MPSIEILKDITPFLSVLVALIAVLLGPLLSSWIARRQLVAPIRQKWIDELRDLITEFLSTAQMIVVFNKTNGILNEENVEKESYMKLFSIERKLTLMLNPSEDLHNELLMSVRKLLDEVEHGVNNLLQFGPLVNNITIVSQKILKKEWVRVKKGKL